MKHPWRPVVRPHLRVAGRERGQMLIVFALIILPVSMVVAAIAVDASIWQSERRGAQKDADLAVLAGALELAKPDPGDADAAARTSLTANDEAGNGGSKAGNIKNLIVDNSCFPGDSRNDAVAIDLNHESQAYFASIFGVSVAPDIGAHAKACAGAAQAPNGIVPIETDLTGPCFTAQGKAKIAQPCPLDFGAEGDNPRGILDLQAPDDYCSDASGSGTLEDLIVSGADGNCLINAPDACDPAKNGPWHNCVAVQNGNPTKVGRAFEDRIAKEGACDLDGDGVEQFLEAVTLAFDSSDDALDIYEPRDCDADQDGVQMSQRLITIIVLKAPPVSGNAGYPIYAFAAIYVEGCNSDPASDANLDVTCDFPGGGHAGVAPMGGGTHLASLAFAPPCGTGSHPTCTPVPTSTPAPGGPTATPTSHGGGGGGGGGNGHIVVWGRLVNLFFAGHEAGPPTTATTVFSISLTQ